MKEKSKIYHFLFFVFGVSFFYSIYMVYGIAAQAYKEQKAFDELKEIVYPLAGSVSDDAQLKETPETNKARSSYAVLKARNPDFFGWISIEGTKLNYPVMHTPEDEEYYLRRDFYGDAAQSGVPFLSAFCYEGCGNYVIYGHNMNNGSMFASLLCYADRAYWEQHPLIQFDTLTTTGEYEVFAAFYSVVYPQDADDVFRFYQYTDLSEPSVFHEYVKRVQRAALYDTGIGIDYGNEILTLSTCSYHIENGRFVVAARKK